MKISKFKLAFVVLVIATIVWGATFYWSVQEYNKYAKWIWEHTFCVPSPYEYWDGGPHIILSGFGLMLLWGLLFCWNIRIKGKQNVKIFIRYLVQGICLSPSYLIPISAFLFTLPSLTSAGSMEVVAAIIIGLTCIFMGFLNSRVTKLLWFPVKTSFKILLLHGTSLSTILLIAEWLILAFVGNILQTMGAFQKAGVSSLRFNLIITLIIGVLLYGFVGKKVAEGARKAK